MKTTYLDYYKLILKKVSFDYNLFKKELGKASQELTMEEMANLKKWLLENGLLTREIKQTALKMV